MNHQVPRPDRVITIPPYAVFPIEQTEPIKRRQPKQKRAVYLPENLPLQKIRQIFLEDADRVLWLISTIAQKRVFDRRLRESFVRLYSPILRQVMGSGYRAIIAKMTGWLVEVDEDYDFLQEHYSKGYCLTEEFHDARLVRQVISDPRVIDELKEERPTTRIDRHLWRYLVGLSVDWAEVDHTDDDGWLGVQRIEDKSWSYVVDKYGRRHTNLTNLPKEARKCLRYEGKRLVGLDIANSQPLVLALSLIEEIKGQKKNDVQLALPDDVLILLGDAPRIPAPRPLPNDLLHYQKLCEQGRLYEFLMERTGMTRRDVAKTIVFGVIYGRSRYDHVKIVRSVQDYEALLETNPESREFSMPLRKLVSEVIGQEFPTLAHYLADLRGEKDRHYKNVARQMQRAESRLMFAGCVRDLMERHPSVPIWTIHDSIYTTAEHEEVVRRVMRDNFQQAGITPTIKTEQY